MNRKIIVIHSKIEYKWERQQLSGGSKMQILFSITKFLNNNILYRFFFAGVIALPLIQDKATFGLLASLDKEGESWIGFSRFSWERHLSLAVNMSVKVKVVIWALKTQSCNCSNKKSRALDKVQFFYLKTNLAINHI